MKWVPFFDLKIGIPGKPADDETKKVYGVLGLELPGGSRVGVSVMRVNKFGTDIHYHKNSSETYILLTGALAVYAGDINAVRKLSILGDSLRVDAGVVHRARSYDKNTAWCLVISTPILEEEDHHSPEKHPPQG